MTDYTTTLHAFARQNWVVIAAYVGSRYDSEHPGFLLFRGELEAPTPWFELAAGTGGYAGAAVHLLRFDREPQWVPVDPDRISEDSHGISEALDIEGVDTLESAANGTDGHWVTVAWEFSPGEIVWASMTNGLHTHDAIEQLTPEDLPPSVN